MEPDARPGLAALLEPFSAEEFLARYWPSQPLFVPGDPDDPTRLVRRLGIPPLRNFDALATVWQQDALALPHRAGDESLGAPVQGPTVRWMYEQGHPLFLHRPERVLPRLGAWIEALRFELGVPGRSEVICSSHATPGGTETALHCDPEASFILQLDGTKIWWVAPNHSTPDPTHRHAIAQARMHAEMAAWADAPAPTRIPDDAVRYELTPGSVLFVPGGHWHATEAPTPSLALMFIVKHASWAAAVSTAIYRCLAADRRFRRLAVGVGTHNARARAGALAEAEALLAAVGPLLADITAERLVMPRFMLSADVRCRREGARLVLTKGRSQRAIDLDPLGMKILDRVESHVGPFTVRDVAGDAPLERTEAVLQRLVAVGYVENA